MRARGAPSAPPTAAQPAPSRTSGRATWFRYASGTELATTAIAAGDRVRLGAHLYWQYGPVHHTTPDGKTALNDREFITRSVFNMSATAKVAARDELSLMLGLSDGESDRGIPQSASDPLREDDGRALFLHLGWKRSFAADSELSVHYYHQDERMRAAWLDADDPSAPVSRDRNSDVSRDSVEVQYSARLSPSWRFLVGAGVSQESVRAPYMFNTRSTLRGTSSQLFGSVVWTPLERLQLDLGVVLEDHHYSGALFSPRLSANYALTPESALRMSAGVSYRAPSMVEARAEEAAYRLDGEIDSVGLIVGRLVKPERVRHVEVGYAAVLRELGLSLDVRAHRCLLQVVKKFALRPGGGQPIGCGQARCLFCTRNCRERPCARPHGVTLGCRPPAESCRWCRVRP